MTYHPTHNCMFYHYNILKMFLLNYEISVLGAVQARHKANSHLPPHTLCFGAVPINEWVLQKDSFGQTENQWFLHGGSWLWLLEFYLQQYESFLIVQEINHQMTPPLYPFFAEERFSLQIYPVADPLHFYFFSTKRYTGYLQTQLNVERRDCKLQGLKRKVYQAGPNLKAAFSQYKVLQFPCTLVHNRFAEMERTWWKAWKVGESQDTRVLSMSHSLYDTKWFIIFGTQLFCS